METAILVNKRHNSLNLVGTKGLAPLSGENSKAKSRAGIDGPLWESEEGCLPQRTRFCSPSLRVAGQSDQILNFD